MLVAQVDRDYLAGDDIPSRKGTKFNITEIFSRTIGILSDKHTRFRVKDDDGIAYYGGWLINDIECEVQQHILAWATRDAGATTIEVKLEEGWTQEIG